MMHKSHTWRSRLTPQHGFWTLVLTLWTSVVISNVAHVWMFSVLMHLSSMLLFVWLLLILSGHTNHAMYISVWAWITGLTAVKVMAYDYTVKHTLVQLQPDGHWVGPLNWHFNLGNVRLRPDGHVHADSECSFCYIWQPLDPELKTQLQLTHWDTWPDWDKWLTKSHRDMIEYKIHHLTD